MALRGSPLLCHLCDVFAGATGGAVPEARGRADCGGRELGNLQGGAWATAIVKFGTLLKVLVMYSVQSATSIALCAQFREVALPR